MIGAKGDVNAVVLLFDRVGLLAVHDEHHPHGALIELPDPHPDHPGAIDAVVAGIEIRGKHGAAQIDHDPGRITEGEVLDGDGALEADEQFGATRARDQVHRPNFAIGWTGGRTTGRSH